MLFGVGKPSFARHLRRLVGNGPLARGLVGARARRRKGSSAQGLVDGGLVDAGLVDAGGPGSSIIGHKAVDASNGIS